MYKIRNKTNDPRKFRIHKTAEAFFIRAGEELIVKHKPIISNTNIFEVINLDNELNEKVEEEQKSEVVKTKTIKFRRKK